MSLALQVQCHIVIKLIEPDTYMYKLVGTMAYMYLHAHAGAGYRTCYGYRWWSSGLTSGCTVRVHRRTDWASVYMYGKLIGTYNDIVMAL